MLFIFSVTLKQHEWLYLTTCIGELTFDYNRVLPVYKKTLLSLTSHLLTKVIDAYLRSALPRFPPLTP